MLVTRLIFSEKVKTPKVVHINSVFVRTFNKVELENFYMNYYLILKLFNSEDNIVT